MTNQNWNEKIKNNFDNAAGNYLDYSNIQRFFAEKIVSFIKEIEPQKGEWIDLGSGTGLLADEIEKEFSNKKVSRIDFSKKMLLQNKSYSKKILWDLNNDLPSTINNCSLLTSNFCIHWLNDPEKIIKSWFRKLISGGYLIISYPTKKCFPEWKETCKKCNIEYSGITFPYSNILKNFLKKNEIFSMKEYNYKETFPNIYKLFRSMINVGAQSTHSKRISVSHFKLLQKKWPKDKYEKVNLTWNINILILQK